MLDLSLDDKVCITNPWDAAMQELDILFNTNNTELIGCPEFGTDFYKYLWSLNNNNREVEKYVNNLLHQCAYLNMFNYSVQVTSEYNESTFERDLYLKITIYNDIDEVVKTYDLSNLLYVTDKK